MTKKKIYCKNCKYYKLKISGLSFLFLGLICSIVGLIFKSEFFFFGVAFILYSLFPLLLDTYYKCFKGINKKNYEDTPTERIVHETELGCDKLNKNNDCKYYKKRK